MQPSPYFTSSSKNTKLLWSFSFQLVNYFKHGDYTVEPFTQNFP